MSLKGRTTTITSTAPIQADDDDDPFFYYLILTMPFLAVTAYVYDAYTLLMSKDKLAGLLSSVLFIFYFLQYSPTINSKLALTVYHFLIWVMVTVGDVLYISYYLRQNNRTQQIRYAGYVLVDFVFILALWSCKMIAVSKTHNKRCRCCTKIFQLLNLNSNVSVHIKVHQKQFFSFVSRLEAILATLIPIFFSDKIVRTTSANIGFFILFDFFYESYHKFQSVWIKFCLYLFASIVTASVATEWLYYVTYETIYSQVSGILELLASCCCCSFIIMHFFPSHFHAKYRHI